MTKLDNKIKIGTAAFVVGFVFSLGLGLSGMTQPAKVIGFLDIFGNWDPSLIFVMAGAIAVHGLTYRFIRKRNSPLLVSQWHVPSKTDLTPSLIIGSVLFGIGWGLAGYCPGPVITSLASFDSRPVLFVISMLLGMFIFNLLNKVLKLRR